MEVVVETDADRPLGLIIPALINPEGEIGGLARVDDEVLVLGTW